MFTKRRIASVRAALERGETVYILGIGAGGHNAGVGLVEASKARGIRLLANHEEERFRAIKHFQRFPHQSVDQLVASTKALGIDRSRIDVACASWDYPHWAAKGPPVHRAGVAAQLAAFSPRKASPTMNPQAVLDAFTAPRRLRWKLRGESGRMPVICLRHHDNHAWFSWGVSPFARSEGPVMVLVVDGAGDDGAISKYVAEKGALRLLQKNDNLWDSLGAMYGMVSSSQGGWPLLSSEGRYMGAAAWGDQSRETNRYYKALRELFVLESEGRVLLNRSLANWHRGGCSAPYTKQLSQIIGPPDPAEEHVESGRRAEGRGHPSRADHRRPRGQGRRRATRLRGRAFPHRRAHDTNDAKHEARDDRRNRPSTAWPTCGSWSASMANGTRATWA
jgi:carbamoyltransferase